MSINLRPGIWTPWAGIYCPTCHTPPEARRSLEPRARKTGEVTGTCEDCGSSVWLPDEVGLPQQVMQAVVAEMRGAVISNMAQTGGMCCAAYVSPIGLDYFICIEAMVEGIGISMFRNEGSESGDPDDWREITVLGTTVTDSDGDDVLVADESHVPEAAKVIIDFIRNHPTFNSRDITMSPVITTINA